MARSRLKARGRREGGTFFALPHHVMESDNFRALPGNAIKLLCDFGSQFHGTNNGDMACTWTIMQAMGWRSKSTLYRALDSLVRHGLVEQTRQGGLHQCSLYALTWLAIDECGGKLDVCQTRTPSGLWKLPPDDQKKKTPSTETVPPRYGIRATKRATA